MSDAPLATEAQTMTVGETLRNARMGLGLSITEVAERLHLTTQVLESIENNEFERLPGVTFARGYVRSYAKILGLDANQVVKLFDESTHSAASTVQSIDRVGEARRGARGMWQFSLFVVLLIILAAAYYGWQTFNTHSAEESSQAAVIDRVEVERADGSTHVQALDEIEEEALDLVFGEPAADDSALELLVEPALPSAESDTHSDAEVDSDAVIETSDQVAETAELLAPGTGSAQLTFTQDSWIRVVDADGKQLSSGTKRAGEQIDVTGKAPLDVHLGFARGVTILYNGEPVDFSSAVSGEIARIKLGQ